MKHCSTKFFYILLGMVVALSLGCTRLHVDTHHRVWEGTLAKTMGDTFDWRKNTAVTFLDMLMTRTVPYPVAGLHHDWVSEADIPALMLRLESIEPCVSVVSTAYSGKAQPRSTEGHEAAFLIWGYRQRFYPPDLASDLFHPNRQEIERWYSIWKTRFEADREK